MNRQLRKADVNAEFRDRPDRTLNSTGDQPAGSVLLLLHGRGADLLLSGHVDVSVEEDLSRAMLTALDFRSDLG